MILIAEQLDNMLCVTGANLSKDRKPGNHKKSIFYKSMVREGLPTKD
jgi:hypothetical protein